MRKEIASAVLVWNGNSLVAGQGTSGPSAYIGAQTLALLGPGVAASYTNLGVGGQTTPQMLTYAQANTIPLFKALGPSINVAWEITNDLYFGATAAQAVANITSYCSTLRAAGFLVIIGNVLPRSNVGTPAGFEASRTTVNTTLDSTWQTFADEYAPVASSLLIGQFGNQLNTTYYDADRVHLNDAGDAVAAPYFARAIARLLTTYA